MRCAISKLIERANFDQTFKRTLANGTQIHAAGKVVEVGELAVLARASSMMVSTAPWLTFLIAPKPKRMDGFPSTSSMSKSQFEALTSGGKDRHAHVARIRDIEGNLFSLPCRSRKQRRHILGGIS